MELGPAQAHAAHFNRIHDNLIACVLVLTTFRLCCVSNLARLLWCAVLTFYKHEAILVLSGQPRQHTRQTYHESLLNPG
jgi:hypothetical protein